MVANPVELQPEGPPPRRVAILRALKLGDLLCAVPAFRALRVAWAEAEIVLIGLPWARSFVERFDAYLDGFREFPGFPGLPERSVDVARVPAFLTEIQAERFDLALQMHGSGSFVNPLMALLGARQSAGFALPGDYRPEPGRYIPWSEQGREIRRLLALVESLGVAPRGEHLEFPIREADRRSGSYACVHPGASVPERRWPADHFAAVADALAGRGLRVVLTGSEAEADLTGSVARSMKTPALDLAGRTDLGAAGALLAGARLLVANDTGVSHLAAALHIPSVILSTGENPARWAPIDEDRHRVLRVDEGIDPGRVLDEVDALLAPDHQPRVATPAVAPDAGEFFGALKG
jgi:ADP-heptose:LPS heptosyltransferase